jgi:mannose-1-phosphate guanylyltransferase
MLPDAGRRMITQAFVLGAGLGTRLRPLTDELPKPLLPIFHKPLITFCLDHLIAAGVRRFVVNTHHLPKHFPPHFPDNRYRDMPVRLIHEPVLLETGGGIKNAEALLGSDPFIVYSGDILTDIDLESLLDEHLRSGNDVTLGLRRTGLASGVTLKNGRVLSITRELSSADDKFDYANVSVWTPKIFQRIPSAVKVSFIPVLSDWIKEGGRIGGVVLNEGRWFNIGNRAEYLAVHRTIAQENWRPPYLVDNDWPLGISQNATVEAGARIEPGCAVGDDCRIGADAILRNSVVWPGAQIASRSDLQGCIVRSRKFVEGSHRDADI